MPSTQSIVDQAKAPLRSGQAVITKPREAECLCCYVVRQLDEFGCDNHLRHALHYRDVVAPRAKSLAKSLGQIGGYCDCEIFMNGYRLKGAELEDASAALPPCKGAHSGSLQPCANWELI